MGDWEKEIRSLKLEVAGLKDSLNYEKDRHEAALQRNKALMQQVRFVLKVSQSWICVITLTSIT